MQKLTDISLLHMCQILLTVDSDVRLTTSCWILRICFHTVCVTENMQGSVGGLLARCSLKLGTSAKHWGGIHWSLSWLLDMDSFVLNTQVRFSQIRSGGGRGGDLSIPVARQLKKQHA